VILRVISEQLNNRELHGEPTWLRGQVGASAGRAVFMEWWRD
jgi:hypothetical protein